MHFSFYFIFALLILLASAWSQEEATLPALKLNLLARRQIGSRGLGRVASTTTTTTTTTTIAPAEEEIFESEDENVEENDNAAVADENGK